MKNYFNEKEIKPSELFWIGIITFLLGIAIAYYAEELTNLSSSIVLICFGVYYSIVPNFRKGK